MGRISMFCGVENYVLRYKSVYYKVITDYVERIQYSVFSFFRCCYHIISVYILYRDELVTMMNNQLYQKSFYLQEFIQWGNRSHR